MKMAKCEVDFLIKILITSSLSGLDPGESFARVFLLLTLDQ